MENKKLKVYVCILDVCQSNISSATMEKWLGKVKVAKCSFRTELFICFRNIENL